MAHLQEPADLLRPPTEFYQHVYTLLIKTDKKNICVPVGTRRTDTLKRSKVTLKDLKLVDSKSWQ